MAFPLWLTKLLVRTRLARFTPRARRLTDGGAAFLRYYSDRVLSSPVDELLDPAVASDPPGPDVIDLNPPTPQIESGLSLSRFTTGRWGAESSRGLLSLRDTIAARYRGMDGRDLNPDTDIIVTHGATGAYAATLDALVNPGDGIVLFDPSSSLFSLGAKSRRARIRWVSARSEEGRCRFVQREFEAAMRGAKLLVLANPGNPTGGCLHAEDFEYIAWIATAYDVLVYADESYDRFRYDSNRASFGAMAGADRRLLTAGSMTQEFGLGALRVGWLAGPRHLVKACGLMANLEAPFVPAPCQQIAARALAEPETTFAKTLNRLRAKRDYALDRLQGMGLEVDFPAGGVFLWVSVAGLGLDGRAFTERLFREHQVQVGPGIAFGPGGGKHIRISFAADDGRLREGLARMAAFIERLKMPPLAQAEPVTEEVMEHAEEAVPLPRPSFSRV